MVVIVCVCGDCRGEVSWQSLCFSILATKFKGKFLYTVSSCIYPVIVVNQNSCIHIGLHSVLN